MKRTAWSSEESRERRHAPDAKRQRREENRGYGSRPSGSSYSRNHAPGDAATGRDSRRERPSVGSSGGHNATTTATTSLSAQVRLLADATETDPHRLAQRQKQIDYGKNTLGYDRYCALVPRRERKRGVHPMTPDKTAVMGKKVFDRAVSEWRKALHKFDPPELQQQLAAADKQVEKEQTAAPIQRTAAPVSDKEVDGKEQLADAGEAGTAVQSSAAPTHSIYDNFDDGEGTGARVNGDSDDDDDDDDDDLL